MGIEENIKNIKEVTKKLILKEGYNNVNISTISEYTTIKRGMIYRSYKNKEDIFLDVLVDALFNYLYSLQNIKAPISNKQFVECLVDNLIKNEIILKLAPIMIPVIEDKASIEGLVKFKKEYCKFVILLLEVYTVQFPENSELKNRELVILFFSLIQGIYPLSEARDKQKLVYEKVGADYVKIDFEKTIKEAYIKLI